MFSVEFLLRSASLLFRYPSAVVGVVRGEGLGPAIDRKRREEWLRMRNVFDSKTKRVFGLQIYLNSNDLSFVSASIATTGWFDLHVTELLKKILKSGMTVIDVGANIGYYTLLSSKIVGKSGLVLAFEPEPSNFGFLVRSVKINNLTNVRVYQEALSDHEGAVGLFLSDPGNPQGHSIVVDHGRGSVQVPSTTLDSLWNSLGSRRIDLIKIRVGAEAAILRGAKRLLSEQRPNLVMAFVTHQWENDSSLLDMLYEWFVVYQIVRTPVLVRKIDRAALLSRKHTELYLRAKYPDGS